MSATRTQRWLALSICAALGSCSGVLDEEDAEPGEEVDAVSATDDFTIAVLPDTQYYNGPNNWVFKDQTSWLVAHANDPDKNIKLVLGLGDIVDGGGLPPSGACGLDANGDPATPPASWQTQWSDAASAIDVLDGHIPYMLAVGNHDYDCEAQRPQPRSLTNWDKHFGPSRYTGKPWWNGSFYSGSHGNFYNVFTINGVQYLVLALEFYPTNSDLAWADAALTNHANMQAIIITHAFLYYDGGGPGTAHRVASGDDDSAASYRLGPSCPEQNVTTCGNGNNGSDMWQKLVSKHKNVVLVLNGHFRLPTPGYAYPGVKDKPIAPPNNGVGYRSEIGPLGNRVNQILSDYQGQGRNGYFGNGYLRLYKIRPSAGVIHVTTYSPSVDLHPSQFPAPGIPLDPATNKPANFKTDLYNQFDVPYANPFATTTTASVSFTPADGAVVKAGTVAISGSATAPGGVKLMQVYVDGVKKYEIAGASLSTTVSLAAGSRRLTVQAQDAAGAYFKAVHYVTAQ